MLPTLERPPQHVLTQFTKMAREMKAEALEDIALNFWWSPQGIVREQTGNPLAYWLNPDVPGGDEFWQAFSPDQQLYLSRARCIYDLFWFATVILGYNRTRPGLGSVDLDPEFHGSLAWHVTYATAKKRIWLLPRGHLKSTVVTVANTIRRIIQHRANIRLLLVSDTRAPAVQLLSEIKQHFTQNDRMKQLWPEMMPRTGRNGDTWNEDAITLPRTIRVKEPVIYAIGMDANATGMHFDGIVNDDVVTKDNVRNPEQRAKLLQAFRLQESILEPGGWHDVVGTRYHVEDLYATILEDDAYSDYFRYIRTAFKGAVEVTRNANMCWATDGEPVWPAKYPPEDLADRRVKQAEEFAGQYLMNPIPEVSEIPITERHKYARDELKEEEIVDKITTVDLAISEKESADNVVVATYAAVLRGNERHVYLLDLDYGSPRQMTPTKTIETIIAHWQKHKSRVAVEAVAYQAALMHFLAKAIEQKRLAMQVEPIRRSKQKKEARIRMNFIPWVAQGRFHVRKDDPKHLALYEECRRWPVGKDDMIDTAADACTLLRFRTLARAGRRPGGGKLNLFGDTGR